MKRYYLLSAVFTGMAATAVFVLSIGTAHPAKYVIMMFMMILLYRRVQNYSRIRAEEIRINGREFFAMKPRDLRDRTCTDRLYLGEGFLWEKPQAEALYGLMEKDPAFCRVHRDPDSRGAAFIQSLGRVESVYLPLSFFDGHTLITGTTGAGKTRLYDLLCAQAVYRGEGLIIIDPKGDRDLYEHLKIAAGACNRELLFFHPAFPNESIGINPVHNFTRSTEIAGRISSLVPTARGSNDPFRSFAFSALNAVVGGLIIIGKRPTLKLIKYYINSRLVELCFLAFKTLFDRHLLKDPRFADEWKILMKETSKVPGRLLTKYEAFYQRSMKPFKKRASQEIETLYELARHDPDHYKKMIASLKPVLDMLTSGELGNMLSPVESDDLSRRSYSLADIVRRNHILYVGLDSLTDGQTGAALGSMLLADLTAVAGNRYNFGKDLNYVNLFVDETAEVINEQLIQMLNKGRGAKFRVTIATQTIADFESGLGSEARSVQVLGNVNNVISLRVIDTKTREYISDSLPKTRILFKSQSCVQNQSSDELTKVKASISSSLTENETEIFPASMLSELPDLEYVARVGGSTVIKGKIPFITD